MSLLDFTRYHGKAFHVQIEWSLVTNSLWTFFSLSKNYSRFTYITFHLVNPLVSAKMETFYGVINCHFFLAVILTSTFHHNNIDVKNAVVLLTYIQCILRIYIWLWLWESLSNLDANFPKILMFNSQKVCSLVPKVAN